MMRALAFVCLGLMGCEGGGSLEKWVFNKHDGFTPHAEDRTQATFTMPEWSSLALVSYGRDPSLALIGLVPPGGGNGQYYLADLTAKTFTAYCGSLNPSQSDQPVSTGLNEGAFKKVGENLIIITSTQRIVCTSGTSGTATTTAHGVAQEAFVLGDVGLYFHSGGATLRMLPWEGAVSDVGPATLVRHEPGSDALFTAYVTPGSSTLNVSKIDLKSGQSSVVKAISSATGTPIFLSEAGVVESEPCTVTSCGATLEPRVLLSVTHFASGTTRKAIPGVLADAVTAMPADQFSRFFTADGKGLIIDGQYYDVETGKRMKFKPAGAAYEVAGDSETGGVGNTMVGSTFTRSGHSYQYTRAKAPITLNVKKAGTANEMTDGDKFDLSLDTPIIEGEAPVGNVLPLSFADGTCLLVNRGEPLQPPVGDQTTFVKLAKGTMLATENRGNSVAYTKCGSTSAKVLMLSAGGFIQLQVFNGYNSTTSSAEWLWAPFFTSMRVRRNAATSPTTEIYDGLFDRLHSGWTVNAAGDAVPLFAEADEYFLRPWSLKNFLVRKDRQFRVASAP